MLRITFFGEDLAGPATRWALGARPGDWLQINGPKASKVIAEDEAQAGS